MLGAFSCIYTYEYCQTKTVSLPIIYIGTALEEPMTELYEKKKNNFKKNYNRFKNIRKKSKIMLRILIWKPHIIMARSVILEFLYRKH